MKRMALYGSRFCCAKGEPAPASLFYDFLFDLIPHTDRFDRMIESTWPVMNFNDTIDTALAHPHRGYKLLTPYPDEVVSAKPYSNSVNETLLCNKEGICKLCKRQPGYKVEGIDPNLKIYVYDLNEAGIMGEE